MKALHARVTCLIYELNKLIPAPDSHLWPRSFGQETVVLTICFSPFPHPLFLCIKSYLILANIKMLFVKPKTCFLIYLDSLLLTHTWWCQRSVWICCGRVAWETRVKDLVSHWDIFVSVPWSKCLTKSLTGYFVFGLLLGDQWLAPLSILIYQSWNLE